MTAKNIAGKVWKILPFISLVESLKKIERGGVSIKNVSRSLRHLVYGSIIFTYLMASAMLGTSNPLNWNEAYQETSRGGKIWNKLYDRATNCVKQDGNPGLTTLDEINEFYKRAGIKVDFNPRTGELTLPRLSKKDLETVIQNCEVNPITGAPCPYNPATEDYDCSMLGGD